MADTTSPALLTLSPANHAVGVPVDASFVLTFDEPILRGTGALFVFDVFGNQLFDMDLGIGVTVTASGSQIIIDPALDLPGGMHILVGSNAGMVTDAAGNPSFPLPVYDFTTASDQQSPYRYGTDGNDAFTPSAALQIFVGGPGIDTVQLDSARSSNTVALGRDRFTVANAAAGTSFDLLGIERVQFSDAKLALDLAGNAGWVAMILGAVFGAPSVGNATYVGIGLGLADTGMNFEALLGYALQARFGTNPDPSALVMTLYTNVVGSAPSVGDLAYFVGLLDSQQLTPVDLGMLAAQHPLNLAHIDFAGLSATGLAYGP
ncbi:Ig-like domain-containing protein [Aquabacterium sp.]|uniref:Ig-like domain-containing protein n=1 Tax=Aquabacterium sp. TaxID=1872578 RepID=UPI0037842A24